MTLRYVTAVFYVCNRCCCLAEARRRDSARIWSIRRAAGTLGPEFGDLRPIMGFTTTIFAVLRFGGVRRQNDDNIEMFIVSGFWRARLQQLLLFGVPGAALPRQSRPITTAKRAKSAPGHPKLECWD